MALPAGRVGVAPDQVDENGKLNIKIPTPVVPFSTWQHKQLDSSPKEIIVENGPALVIACFFIEGRVTDFDVLVGFQSDAYAVTVACVAGDANYSYGTLVAVSDRGITINNLDGVYSVTADIFK